MNIIMASSKSLSLLCGIFISCLVVCQSKTAEEWKSRMIYQILTDRFAPSGNLPTTKCTKMRSWCGGTFKGIQNHLDYIQELGFNAIWISPVVLNTQGGFHGYWAKSIYEIEPHFGTKEELKSLVKACHERDIWVMVDVVANHMGYPPGTNWTTPWNSTLFDNFYQDMQPFNKSEYYHANHPYIKWPEECHDERKIQLYWLANLADLNQSHPFVEKTLLHWIQYLIAEYNFDGCRVDTVIQVPKPFWNKFQKAGKVFMLGEANNGPPPCGTLNLTSSFQGDLDSVLDFPLYWTMRYIFQENPSLDFNALSDLLKRSSKKYKDRSVIGGFIDNHDHARFLHINPNYVSLRNNLAYLLMSQCIPVLYYGTEQGFNGRGDPENRESLWPYMNTSHVLFTFIKKLVRIRNKFPKSWLKSPQIEQYVTSNVYAFSRDKTLTFITTEKKDITVATKSHPYSAGDVLQNLLNPTHTTKITKENQLKMTMYGGEPVIFTVVEKSHCQINSISYTLLIYLAAVILHFC